MNDVLKVLVSDGVLDDSGAKKVTEAVARGTLLEDALREAAPEEKILRSLGVHFEIPFIDLGDFGNGGGGEPGATKEFLTKFPVRVLLYHHLLPLKDENGVVHVATCRLFDTAGLDELRLATGHDFRPVLAPTGEIDRCIKRVLGIGADTLQSMGDEDGGIKVLEQENDDMDLSRRQRMRRSFGL